MLSFELIEAIAQLRSVIKEDSYLMKFLSELAFYQQEINQMLALKVGNSNNLVELFEKIIGEKGVLKRIKQVKHRTLFVALEDVEKAVETFFVVKGNEFPDYEIILHLINQFSSSYEGFISNHSVANGLELLLSAMRLEGALYGVLTTLDTISQKLHTEEHGLKENEGELSIVLHPHMDLLKVSIKLSALAKIYQESCELLNVSYAEYPLRIAKMESGSLWLKLIGNKETISFVRSHIEKAIDYFHRNYTREGKIEALPRKIEAIDKILDLKNKLSANGISTAQMEEQIAKSGAKLAGELSELLGDEPVINVDGTIHSVGKEFEKKYLEGSKQLLLESPQKDENTNGADTKPEVEKS